MAKEIEEYEVSLGDLKVSFDDNVDSSKYVPIDRYEEDIKGITDKLADINVDLSGNEPSAVSISSNGVTYKIQNLKEGKAVSIDSANKVNVKYDTNKFYINENNELTYDISKLSVNADNDTLFFDEKDKNKLKAALSLEYDNTNHKINLLSKNGIVSAIDAGDFIKDGMLSNVSVSGNILIMSFNTDSGIEDIEVDLSVLQKIYKGDNTTINVSDKGVISLNTSLLDKINGYESQITSLSSDIDSLRTEYQTADNNIYTAIEEAERDLNDTIDEKIAGVGDDKITKVTNLLEYEPKENEIVQYIGESNSFYKNGYFYRKNEDGSWSSVDTQQSYSSGDNIVIENGVISLDDSIKEAINENTSDIEELESTCTAHGTAIQEITSDIEEIEDRIGNLDYVPQISDLSNYNCEVGTIVQYIGETTEEYINGYFYKKEPSESWIQTDVQPADDISPLENRVGQAEEDIEELKNRSTAEWGNLTGDITDQEDLNNALNAKLDGTNGEGANSSQLGLGTIAKGAYQVVLGRYNVIDNENKYALIVGNGTDNDNRSNAYTVDWNGNIQFNDISYVKNLGNVLGIQATADVSNATEQNVLYIVTGE